MEKDVPQKAHFESAEKSDVWHHRLIYLYAIISFANGLLRMFNFTHPLTLSLVDIWIPGGALVLVAAIAILQCLFTHQYQMAEEIRRDAFFDNSFGSLLADKQSNGYFSNDAVSEGLKKSLLNISENCFYSLDTIRYMLHCRIKRAILLGLLLLAVIALNIGDHLVTVLALNFFLALGIVRDIVSLYRLRTSLEKVHDNCKAILTSQLINDDAIDQQPVAGKVMREIVRYETALAYASTMLDSKYFAKINTHKSKEWEEYKKRFCKEKIS